MENQGILTTALTKDGGARLIFAVSTGVVQYAAELHKTSRTVSAALGRCLTAASIMGSTLKDEAGSLTLRFAGGGPAGQFTCVAGADGNVRGCCEDPGVELPPNAAGKLDVGGAVGRAGELSVVRDYGFGEPYVGVSQLVSGEIAEDVTAYYAVSEQTPTVCALGVGLHPDGRVKGAGGYLLQLLPGADEALTPLLTDNVERFPAVSGFLAAGGSPAEAAEALFSGIPFDVMQTSVFAYRCNCRREKYRSAIEGLGLQALAEMRDSGEGAEVVCRFCCQRYVFDTAELAALYDARAARLRERAKETRA